VREWSSLVVLPRLASDVCEGEGVRLEPVPGLGRVVVVPPHVVRAVFRQVHTPDAE